MKPEVPNLLRANLEKTIDAIRDFVNAPEHRLRLFGYRESIGMVEDPAPNPEKYYKYKTVKAVRITLDIEDNHDARNFDGSLIFDPLPSNDLQYPGQTAWLIEYEDRAGGSTIYFGKIIEGVGPTPESVDALRFQRKEDAEALIHHLNLPAKANQHMWS